VEQFVENFEETEDFGIWLGGVLVGVVDFEEVDQSGDGDGHDVAEDFGVEAAVAVVAGCFETSLYHNV
jgi:hypothetical protein